jgi:hypothetical protein
MSETTWWVTWLILAWGVLVASIWAYPHVAFLPAGDVLMVVTPIAFLGFVVSGIVVFARLVTWPLRRDMRPKL